MLRTDYKRLRHKLSVARGESGQAMLVVLAALALMATVPLAVVSTTVNQVPLTTSNLNWNAAYEAAQAGLNNYTQQVDANPSYTEWSTNNTRAMCNGSNPVAPPSGPGNQAFCGWEAVSTNPNEWFEYAVSTSTGKVVLTVSGKAGVAGSGVPQVVRTFRYQMASQATLNDIYWTASEDDGAIVFDSNDVLYGPVFSDDDFYIDGDPTFTSTVESANSGGVGSPYWKDTSGNGSSHPDFEDGAPTLAASENIIANGVQPDIDPAEDVGCYINGNATITLSGTTLEWTTSSGAVLDNNSSNPNSASACGATSTTNGTPNDQPETFSNLAGALYYVNGNITINGGGYVSGYLTLVSNGSITLDGSITYGTSASSPCADITGGQCSTPVGEGSDVYDALGLIAEDYIYVSDSNAATTIDAAMIAITDSFENSYYTKSCGGSCPTLTVFGSIAQNVRGPVGEESGGSVTNGYAKAYYYDMTLQTLWPPFFIPPAGATWTPRSYEECASGSSNSALGTPGC